MPDRPVTAPAPNDADPRPSSALVPKKPLLMRFGKWVQPRINALIARSSRVGDRPVYDTREFPWVARLEENWEVIEEEVAAVLGDLERIPPLATISPDHRRIAPPRKWRSFFLIGYRYRAEENCRRCPRTTELVSGIPGLNSAFFSILEPGTHIPLHTGVTKLIMTCHLGIRVPREADKCWMDVAGQVLNWQAGRAIVFDDTFIHEVRNDTAETRVVLLIQFRRPAGPLGRLVGSLFLEGVRRSRFVQDARRGVRDWKG